MARPIAIGRIGGTAVVAFAALAASFSALSQDAARVYRIGFLIPRSLADFAGRDEAFRAGLRDLGYVEGKNVAIEWRTAEGEYNRLPALVGELIRSKPDVLVVDSTPGVKAAQAATTTIPIVMLSVGDPVGSGIVASLSRPGGNITGLSNVVADLTPKYVELLHAAIPDLSRIAVLTNSDNLTHPRIARQLQTAAAAKGLSVVAVSARNPAEIEAAFATMRKNGAAALIVLGDPLFGQQRRQIADLALKNRVATVATNRALAEGGALMSYGQDLVEHYRRAATYVDRIVKGAKPRDLPVEQSTKIELIINMKTAKALGVAIPQALQLRADEMIQ